VSQPIVAGWNERVDLPEWGIYGIRAKLDTGAKTSSLHVSSLKLLKGRKRVKFSIISIRKKARKTLTLVAPVSRISKVKTSPKHVENRVFIKTTCRLGPVENKIEINLIDRTGMIYRMLLGRTALSNHFLVDSSRFRLLDSHRKKQGAKRGSVK
jgi:hypothetical protein